MKQDYNLGRVSEKIAEHILEFCRRKGKGTQFHMADLVAHVVSAVPDIAPDSPSRILRDLRKKSLLDYRVVSRSQSLYEIV